MRRILYSTLIVGAFSMAAAGAYAQQQDPPRQQPGANAARNLRARVVRVDGNDRVVVRTQDNRDVILNVSPQTKYIVNGQPSRLTDLRVDQNINTVYTMDGDRYIVSQIQVGDNAAVGAPADNANARVFRGRVTKAFNNNQLTVKSQDGKEVTFMTRPNQQLAVTGKFTKIQEIPVGTDVQVTYTEQDNHWFIDSIAIAPINANNDADSVQGTVVRIVGRDQVVVKTADGKEVTVFVAPQTTYRIDDQPAQFTDFQAGQNVRIVTETRDRRLFGRSILGIRRVR